MSIIDHDKYKYEKTKVRDSKGKARTSLSNGDAVAQCMAGLTHDEVVKVMKKNGLTDKLGKHADNPVNPGQFRMLVGNSLRAIVRKGEKSVDINGIEVKRLDQKVPVNKVETAPKTSARKPAKKVTKKAA